MSVLLYLTSTVPAHAEANVTSFAGGTLRQEVGRDALEQKMQPTVGLAAGVSRSILGFEVEWFHSAGASDGEGNCQDPRGDVRSRCAPSLNVLSGNVLLQTVRSEPLQLYATGGVSRV